MEEKKGRPAWRTRNDEEEKRGATRKRHVLAPSDIREVEVYCCGNRGKVLKG